MTELVNRTTTLLSNAYEYYLWTLSLSGKYTSYATLPSDARGTGRKMRTSKIIVY